MKLGERMKSYEHVWKQKLIRRMPVIIRLDGKAFHTFTKKFKRPFDDIFIDAMQRTTKYLVENIQGCKFGYTQSDEISLLITDYDTYDTEAWFDNNIQKIVSISAAMASVFFNKQITLNHVDHMIRNKDNRDIEYENAVLVAMSTDPVFDARVFNLDKDEVCNYFIWRQEDWIKNAIGMIARMVFSEKELYNKSTIERKQMVIDSGYDMSEFKIYHMRGSAVYDGEQYKPYDSENGNLNNENEIISDRIIIDKEIPIFKEDRNFIEKYVYLDDDNE